MKTNERLQLKVGRYIVRIGYALAWPGLALADFGGYVKALAHVRIGHRLDAEMKAAPPSTFVKATRIE